MDIKIRRYGVDEVIEMFPDESALDLRFLVLEDNRVNAAASQDTVVITYGLRNFIKTDNEIAAVLSHEIAHVIRGHIKRKIGSGVVKESIVAGFGITVGIFVLGVGTALQLGVSLIGGLFTRNFSRNLECEVEYFGPKIMYYTILNPEAMILFYERFAVEIPRTMTKGSFKTHSTSEERTLRLLKTLNQIKLGVSFLSIEESL